MRNIFDQYSQPENQLTHALVSTLEADSRLLRRFVAWLCGKAPSRKLEIVEQRLPGEEESDEGEAERRGLPDAWIHDKQSWALILENKIQAPLNPNQLARHRRMAERRGFSDIYVAAVVARGPKRLAGGGVRIIEWTELYSWLLKERTSEWAVRLAEYMEILERKLAEQEYLREGTLTVFAGIPFGKTHPYNYHEAKRLLRLALDELRTRRVLQRELGMNSKGAGRPAITGREGSSVWDFLPLARARGVRTFTEYPHLTLGIQRDRLLTIITIPNGIRPKLRRNLLIGGKGGFLAMIEQVHNNLHSALNAVEGAVPYVEIVQRHYPTQRSEPLVDARLQFDLRTAFRRPNRWRKSVKTQPQWIDAVYNVLASKHSNVQAAVGVAFPYDRCPVVHTPGILNNIADTWLACKPLIRRALG